MTTLTRKAEVNSTVNPRCHVNTDAKTSTFFMQMHGESGILDKVQQLKLTLFLSNLNTDNVHKTWHSIASYYTTLLTDTDINYEKRSCRLIRLRNQSCFAALTPTFLTPHGLLTSLLISL